MTEQKNTHQSNRADDFGQIHQLIREQHYQHALDCIYNAKRKDIYATYHHDQNHAWYLVADLFYKMGQLNQAIFAFQRAIECWQEDVDVYLGWSNSLNQQGAYRQAIEVLNQALPFSSDARLYYQLGNNLFDLRCFDDAIFQYEKIQAKDHTIYTLALKNMKHAKRQKTKK